MKSLHYHQERYWRELIQLKIQILYLAGYEMESKKVDKTFKVFLAIASSGSIAAWAIWQPLQFIWATIIAASQLLSAIKDLLPYQRRVEKISALGAELGDLFIFAESSWYSVAEGELSDVQIHRLVIEVKRRIAKSAKKHLKDEPLPMRRKLMAEAAEQAKIYFKPYYELEGVRNAR